MGKLRRCTPCRLENQNMFESVCEVVLPTNDVADVHVGVVSAGCQVVGRHSIAAQKREVFDVCGSLSLLTVNSIYKTHVLRPVTRHAKTQGKRFSRCRPPVALLAR